MTMIKDVMAELFSMFMADAVMSVITLALVGVVALMVQELHVDAVVAGFILLLGCLVNVIAAAVREARQRNSGGKKPL